MHPSTCSTTEPYPFQTIISKIYLVYINVLPTCLTVHQVHAGAPGGQKGMSDVLELVTGSYEWFSMGAGNRTQCPVQEQQTLLRAKASLQPLHLFFEE